MAQRVIELSEDGDELVVRFRYDARLVTVVKSLPTRRFDPLTKRWLCPADSAREVVDALIGLGFEVAAPVRRIYLEQGGTGLGDGLEPAADEAAGGGAAKDGGPGPSPPPPPDPSSSPRMPGTLTVSELNARVHQVLRRAFPESVWIVGETAGFDRNRHRPHVHFQLLEKAAESEGGAVRSSVEAVLFAGVRREIERMLKASDSPFELRDGIEVRLRARVDLYEPRGSYQLVVEEIDPVHTLGKIAQNRAAVLAELDRLGLREANRALPFPDVPLRIGLITSLGSDAYNDFVNELSQSGYAFEITAAGARMQGAGLERGLVAALSWFTHRASAFDALAIVRGGGARGDLLGFDNLQVALAVARCPIKVVSGIGHQRDVSVIDLIAHCEKTPTAAAAALVDRVAAFERRLVETFGELAGAVRARLSQENGRLRDAGRGIAAGARQHVRRTRRSLAELRERLALLGRTQVKVRRSLLSQLASRLDPRRLALHFERRRARLDGLGRLAASLDPAAVLRRGFAHVRDAEGRTLRDATAVAKGAAITARLARGRLHARVDRSETLPDPDPALPAPPTPGAP